MLRITFNPSGPSSPLTETVEKLTELTSTYGMATLLSLGALIELKKHPHALLFGADEFFDSHAVDPDLWEKLSDPDTALKRSHRDMLAEIFDLTCKCIELAPEQLKTAMVEAASFGGEEGPTS